MGDECAIKHEIQTLCKPCQVESEGAAGKLGVLPRETSLEAGALGEESAEVVVGGWKFLARIFHRPPCTKLGTLISTAIYRGMGDSGSAVGFRQCV